MSREGIDEIVATDSAAVVGIVKGRPVREEIVERVTIYANAHGFNIVEVEEYKFLLENVEDLGLLYGIFAEGCSTPLSCFLETAMARNDLRLLWFKEREDPLLGFRVGSGVYAVTVPLTTKKR